MSRSHNVKGPSGPIRKGTFQDENGPVGFFISDVGGALPNNKKASGSQGVLVEEQSVNPAQLHPFHGSDLEGNPGLDFV